MCLSLCLLSYISPLEHLFIVKILSRTQRATEVKIFVGFSLKPLHYGIICLPAASYSGILHNFLMEELSKKANSRLNTTWSMTQCKAASFFLFSFRLLPTNLPYTSRCTHFSSACTFRIRACVHSLILGAHLCVCLLSHISPLECLFILKILSCTQWATEVKKICGVFFETTPFKSYSLICLQ